MASITDAGVRATSLAMSAGVLGLVLIAALTMRFAMAPAPDVPDGPSVDIVRPSEPPKPEPRPRPREEPPLVVHDNIVISESPPRDLTEPPTQTEYVFTPPPTPTVTDPSWTRRPRDLARFYPARARNAGIEGEVVLDCAVSPQGALNCAVARETPLGWGFGEAAQRIAREHRMTPAMRDGAPVEARYRMRLPFELD